MPAWHGYNYIAIASYIQISKVRYIFTSQIVQELLEEPPQDAAISEKIGKNSIEIQLQIDIPPTITRDAQTQVAPETRHIAIGKAINYIYARIFNYCILFAWCRNHKPHQQSVILAYNVNYYYLHALTSTPTKASVGASKPILSDTYKVHVDDITDHSMERYCSTAQSTIVVANIPPVRSEPELNLSVEKQQTYLVFESALLLLFSICFMCRSTYISIEKFTRGSFLCITQICSHCNNTYVWESTALCRENSELVILWFQLLYFTLDCYLQSVALRVFSSLNCATITRKTCFRHQKTFLQPAINCPSWMITTRK